MTLEVTSNFDRFVAIDVEPGGISRPVGNVGLIEVTDGQLGESLHLQFDALAPAVQMLTDASGQSHSAGNR